MKQLVKEMGRSAAVNFAGGMGVALSLMVIFKYGKVDTNEKK